MITVEKRQMRRLVGVLFLLALVGFLLPLLLGCKGEEKPSYAELFDEGEEIPEPFCEGLWVVLPADATPELVARAERFGEELEEQTDLPCELHYDYEPSPKSNEKICEILLGNADRAPSREFLSDLRWDDYGFCFRDGALLVGGHTDDKTLLAIESFAEEALPYADCQSLLSTGGERFFRKEYSCENVTLNGYALEKYIIVYPAKMGAEGRRAAMELRREIGRRCGYGLIVMSDADAVPEARSICLGRTEAAKGIETIPAEKGLLAELPYGVAILGENPVSLSYAVQAFCDRIPSEGAESVSLTVSQREWIPLTGVAFRMRSVHGTGDIPAKEELSSLSQEIRDEKLDLVRLISFDPAAVDKLAFDLSSSGYERRAVTGTNVVHLYRRDTLREDGTLTTEFGAGSLQTVAYAFCDGGQSLCIVEVFSDENTRASAEEAAALLRSERGSGMLVFSSYEGDPAVLFQNLLPTWDLLSLGDEEAPLCDGTVLLREDGGYFLLQTENG